MNPNIYSTLIIGLCIAVPVFLAGWGLAAMIRRYLEISTRKAVLLLVLSLTAGTVAGVIRFKEHESATPVRRWGNSNDVEAMTSVFAALLAVVAVIFLVQLHSKWIAGRLTEAEKKPDMDGARAWLGAGNLVCVVLLSLLAWLSFDYSPGAVAVLGLLALVAYPVMNSASAHFHATLPPPETNGSERQRVLNMLDNGKITASECAELLGALNISENPRAARAVAPPRKLALIGALLLLVGFFLPWFSINPQTEVNRLTGGLGLNLLPNGSLPGFNTWRIAGGDVQHGLGWLVLFLGVAAAALPYVAGNLQEQTRQRAILAGLGVGAVILLYLATQNLRFVSIGIFLALVGYGLQLAGALQGGRFSGQGAG